MPCASDPRLQQLTPVRLLTADQKVVIQNLRESYTQDRGRGSNLAVVDQTDPRGKDPICSLFIMEPSEDQPGEFIIRPASDRWISFETQDPKRENSLVFLFGWHVEVKEQGNTEAKVYRPCEGGQKFHLDASTGLIFPTKSCGKFAFGADGTYIKLMNPSDDRCLNFVIRPVLGDRPDGAAPPGQLVYGPTGDAASNILPAPKCDKSRQELQKALKASDFGSNEAIFNAFFMRKAGVPAILCALCEQTIVSHAPAPPGESTDEAIFSV